MHASNLLIMLVCTHCLAVCACVCALKRPSVCVCTFVCVCVYLRSIRSITSHIATHALLLLRSPLWLLRVDCFGVSFSITFVHLCACCCCCLPFSTCFQLRCPQCASLKTIGHIHCVPSSSLHAHDINMAEFACMAGRYADYC